MVPAGRLFLRRLIDLSTTVRKLHHHISLNAEARADIRWWDSFLPSWNGVAMFLDPEWTAADSLQLYTDASGSLGFGAYFNGAWFRGDWQPHQRLPLCSIQWQELFAIVAAASTWGHLWAGLRIHFHCDNLPIVQAWARQSAKHPDLMRLLRTLFLVAAQHSFTIRLSHLPGRLNSIADALSRNNLPLFFTLAPQADHQPTQPHITCPRPEPPSPAPTEQSHGPIYCNHLCHWDQALPGFLLRFQLIPVPGTHTICSPPQPDPELQDHSGLCGSAQSHSCTTPWGTRAPLPVTQRCDLPSGVSNASRSPSTSSPHDCR